MGYDTLGTAIGLDTLTNDYILAIRKVKDKTPNAKFLIQVPFKCNTFTKDSAKKMVTNIRTAFPADTFYYAIGNEWDRYLKPASSGGGKYTSTQIKNIIKSFSVEMKGADPSIKVVAPALSYFSAQDSLGQPIMNRLIGGADSVTGRITGSIYPLLNAGQYYFIDVVDFHTYGGNYGNLKNLSNSNFNATENGLINYSYSGFTGELSSLQTLLNTVNSTRAANPLTFAVTELNVCYKNPVVPIDETDKTNDYYRPDINTYKSGSIHYPFSELAEGKHTLEVSAYDVQDNNSKGYIEFIVAKSAQLALTHVLNYPNPFTTRTQFYFEQNKCCQELQVELQVFTISGKLVKNICKSIQAEGYRSDPIEWDGKDDFGDPIGKGVYVYKLKIKTDDGSTAEKYEKLVILN